MARARRPGKCLGRSIGTTVNREATASRICLHRHLNRILGKGSRLRNRPIHCDGSRIVSPRVRPKASASPAGETVTYLSIVGWCCTNRHSRSAVPPPTRRTYGPTDSGRHRQVVLRAKCRCVGLVSSRCSGMRDSTAVTPPSPNVTNACATALRGCRGNSVTRTGCPGKCLCRTVSSAVNGKRETCRSCLNRHLNR